ncbi:MAG: nucleoside triphosphate pyrophosphohydrolase [Gammaproteobacteria bacterium]|nr:nucleoside triphosphate pyrophosphohydrolase [Gammaproteobacteria bacterium]HXK55261.1 nucleoside triphosphate pyrophosphohydrolase [Gammaproteobacteria bacterium]
MQNLLEIMARLRDRNNGCPWDLEQTFESILPHTIEEAYEVADAIRRGEMSELRDELGDLLFQIVFYAQLAAEEGAFDFDDVVSGISDKMVRRHPHVFGAERVADVAEQSEAWENHKAAERRSRSAGAQLSEMDGVALALPALIRAEKLQKRAAKVGFDWPSVAGPMAKIREEIAEIEAELDAQHELAGLREEMGDLLFSCVNLARHLGVDAESALYRANAKFERRFRALEEHLKHRGVTVSGVAGDQLDEIWESVKTEVGHR